MRVNAVPAPGDLFIAPDGNDNWSGRFPIPNALRTDGPLGSIAGTMAMLRELHRAGRLSARVTVWIRGGRYQTLRPMEFDAQQSVPVTFAAYPGEEPVFDGGARITRFSEETANGQRVWVADVASIVVAHPHAFRSLFVNGQRKARTRFPRTGYLKIEAAESCPGGSFMNGTRRFTIDAVAASLLTAARNLHDIEVIALHMWVDERMPIAAFDASSRRVTASRTSIFSLGQDRYYLENAFEAMTEPGDWYLDRPGGKLYYLPHTGEEPGKTEVVVPLALQFLRLTGDIEANKPVEGLEFRGLAFEYSDWVQPEAWCHWYDPFTPRDTWRFRDACRHFVVKDAGNPRDEKAAVPQAAYNVPGVIHLCGCRNITIEDCRIEHVGFGGIDIREGCSAIRICGNTIRDMGGGGVKMDGAGVDGPLARQTSNIRVTDNTICQGGRVFVSAMGVVCMFSHSNVIAHNHIHDFFQTGISVGWRWDYEPHVTRNILIEKNHLHHLGQGVTSDMGGIYLLGVLSGTFVRGNVVRDMLSDSYGACGIYLDQAASGVVIERNIVYNVGEAVSVHWNRNTTYRNNIFAFSAKQGVFLGREPHNRWVEMPPRGLTFERNIFLLSGEPAFIDYERFLEGPDPFLTDLNCYWDTTMPSPIVYKFCPWHGEIAPGTWDYAAADGDPKSRLFSLDAWQKTRHDHHSVAVDPQFVNPAGGDFTLASDSPVLQLGFEPIDVSDLGPRPSGHRE